MAFPTNSSPKIQPTDHISTALVYLEEPSKIQGARYHLVATYSVIIGYATDWLIDATDLAKPKSASLARQSESRRILEGFRSRWISSPECIYLMPFRTWYMTYFLWTAYIILALTTACKSVSMKSNTRQMSLGLSALMILRRLTMLGCPFNYCRKIT